MCVCVCVCVCVHVSGCGSVYMCMQEHVYMHEGKVVTKSTKLQPVLIVFLLQPELHLHSCGESEEKCAGEGTLPVPSGIAQL